MARSRKKARHPEQVRLDRGIKESWKGDYTREFLVHLMKLTGIQHAGLVVGSSSERLAAINEGKRSVAYGLLSEVMGRVKDPNTRSEFYREVLEEPEPEQQEQDDARDDDEHSGRSDGGDDDT